MKCWVELKVKPSLRLLDFEHLERFVEVMPRNGSR